MSPTQREMHIMMVSSETNIVVNNSANFYNFQNQQQSSINEQQKMVINDNKANNSGQIRNGLNVMGGNYKMNNVHQIPRPSPNNSLTKLNQNHVIRPKSITSNN
jgi:hypothetical protein